jgi:hypothetical protein
MREWRLIGVPEAVARRHLLAVGRQQLHDWERAIAWCTILQQSLVVVPEIQ